MSNTRNAWVREVIQIKTCKSKKGNTFADILRSLSCADGIINARSMTSLCFLYLLTAKSLPFAISLLHGWTVAVRAKMTANALGDGSRDGFNWGFVHLEWLGSWKISLLSFTGKVRQVHNQAHSSTSLDWSRMSLHQLDAKVKFKSQNGVPFQWEGTFRKFPSIIQ